MIHFKNLFGVNEILVNKFFMVEEENNKSPICVKTDIFVFRI